MIFVMIRLFEIYLWVILCNFREFPVEILPDFIVNDRLPVFGRQDNVVIRQVDAVFIPSVLMWLVHTVIVA